MFNEKQIELSNMLFKSLKAEFPEIELAGINPGSDNPNNIWVTITTPEDEDREIQLFEKASEISTDILLDYGYSITIFPADPPLRRSA